MGDGHYCMLIVEITMQITKIIGFCGIPEMIQVIIRPNSKLRSSLDLEIVKNCGQKWSILKHLFRSKCSLKTKLK